MVHKKSKAKEEYYKFYELIVSGNENFPFGWEKITKKDFKERAPNYEGFENIKIDSIKGKIDMSDDILVLLATNKPLTKRDLAVASQMVNESWSDD